MSDFFSGMKNQNTWMYSLQSEFAMGQTFSAQVIAPNIGIQTFSAQAIAPNIGIQTFSAPTIMPAVF